MINEQHYWHGYNCTGGFAILRGLYSSADEAENSLITLYGINNCDTVKKARKWLEDRGIEYAFHDFREDGLSEEQVRGWLRELDWQNLVNKRSTSWKALDQATRDTMDSDSALAAIMDQPTLIKRPLLDTGHERFTGFSAASYEKIFNKHTL